MKKTSRRSFAKSVAIGLAGIPLAHSPVPAQDKRKPRKKAWVSDDDLEIRQTSPITVGGGGSVGIGFDRSHYSKVSDGQYQNATDELITTAVVHQNGKLLKNFVKEIKGKTCIVTISTVDAGGSPSPITIDSHRHGPLVIKFDENAFPYDSVQDFFYNKVERHVTSVVVKSGGKTYTYDIGTDWKGVIWGDDV